MKILFTINTISNSGTEKSTLDIISHFSKTTQVKVVSFYKGVELKSSFDKAGIEVIELGFPLNSSWLKGVLPLLKILKEEKPDLVVSSLLSSNLISRVCCFFTGIPLAGTFVSDSYSEIRTSSFSRKRKIAFFFYYWLDRITSGIPRRYISNSKFIKESNAKKLNIPHEKIEVVYRGRDTSLFPEKTNELIPDQFRFVYLARLLETKGLKELIKAFDIVIRKHPEITLDIYGEGNFRETATSMIQLSGLTQKIKLHGNTLDGWRKLYDGDCFIFPSWYEGFSGALVEAMMVGIPIIASDIPMNLEAVESGESALVYPVKDEKALSEKMIWAIEHYDEMCIMASRARQKALEQYDIRFISTQYEGVLNNIVSKKNR
jgi:glycosyltransferase involved in cell wall biosynthesis